MNHLMTNIEHIKKFITGGNATFTIRNKTTNNHLTFNVKRFKGTKDKRTGFIIPPKHPVLYVRFQSTKLEYIGAIPENGEGKYTYFKVNSKINDVEYKYPESIKVAALVFEILFNQRLNVEPSGLPKDCEVYHIGQCGVCARPLTDPLSIEIGVGPKCRETISITE